MAQQRSGTPTKKSVHQPHTLAVSILLALVCGFVISSGRALRRPNYIAQHRSPVSAADSTIFCDSAANANTEYTEADVSCDRIGEVEDVYTIENESIGAGYSAEGKLLTHKQSGDTFVARFLKPDRDPSERADAVNTINFARKACGNPYIMQLADVKCYQGRLTLLWTRCQGEKLEALLQPKNQKDYCPLPDITLPEIQTITKQLVNVVNYLMERGVFHGDIFFNNLFYDLEHSKICLIDFDAVRTLADNYYLPANRNKVEHKEEIGSIKRGVHGWHRMYQDDMLAVGTVLGGLIGIPKFQPDQKKRLAAWTLEYTVNLLGVADYKQYKKQYKLKRELIPDSELEELPKKRTNWNGFITDCNRHLATKEAVDLLDKILRYSFIERYEFFKSRAAKHPFLRASS